MNTRNLNPTAPSSELISNQQEVTLVELKTLTAPLRKNLVAKGVSLQPSRMKPTNSMVGMRSLKPNKGLLG